MPIDEVIDEIIEDLAAGLIDKSDEEIADALAKYDLSEEDGQEILDLIASVRDAEAQSDEAVEKQNESLLDTIDEMADEQATNSAQQMANEDNTPVTVTEEDKDKDGDPDKVTIEKDSEETDGIPLEFEDDTGESENTGEGDEPHDEDIAEESDDSNVTNDIAKHLSNYRW